LPAQPNCQRDLIASATVEERPFKGREKAFRMSWAPAPVVVLLSVPASSGTFGQLLSIENEAEWPQPLAQRASRLRHPKLWELQGETMNISQQAGNETRFPLAEQELRRELEEEAAKIRRLQVMISMVMSVIGQDPNLTVEEASELAAGAKRVALAMFPDKELAFDLLYRPRLQRLMRERFHLS
jgi:hypothetical protein